MTHLYRLITYYIHSRGVKMVKIQKQPNGGLYVTIPFERVEEMGIAKGDEGVWTKLNDYTLKFTLMRGL